MNSGVMAPRVVFFNPALYAVGGMQAWLASLMPELRSRGWEVWLALPTGPHNDAAAYLANYPWEPHELVENPTCSRLGRRRGVRRALARVRPDVLVVANLVSVYAAVQEMRARGDWAPRVVACVHTLDPGIFADLKTYRPVLDALVAPNRLIAAAAQTISGLPEDRIFHAPYRVEVPPLPPAEAMEKSLTLVFAHRLDQHQKRALDLPDLVAALGRRGISVALEIVGSGPEETPLRSALQDAVAAGRVHFVGTVPPSDLRERALRPGRVCLVLSSWEMGPLVAWQAMAWGCVVASSEYLGSGLEGFLRDGENAVTFPVGDMEKAAASISRLVDPEVRWRLAIRAWSDAGERFSSAAAGGGWDRALREVMARKPLPAPPPPTAVVPAGRLDRILGVGAAERLRRVARLRIPTSGPGDEWPHTESNGLARDDLFARLGRLDRIHLPADSPV